MPKRIGPRSLCSSRYNFKRIDDTTARRLLDKYGPIIKITAKRLAGHSYATCTVDQDDLIAVGQMAVLEAQVTYRTGMGATLDTWVRKHIRWRITEEAFRFAERPLKDPNDAERLLNGSSPAEQYDLAYAREAVGILNPREAVVMVSRMEGYTYEEIGDRLGVSRQTIFASERRALRQLAAWADDED